MAQVLFRHGPDDFVKGLAVLGVGPGDTILVHSSFGYATGFTGGPRDVVDCLLRAVGPDGNLLMVSIPYKGSAYDYLRGDPLFDVRRTMSQMGIISETFRRRSGVRRSLHPTHPVLAFGKDAEWLIRDHEKSRVPCGRDTPFGKLRDLGGKVVFLGAPFRVFTFIHYLEDLLQDSIPFPVYRQELMRARVLDDGGCPRTVETRVFSKEVQRRRDPWLLEKRLRRKGLLLRRRVGGTRLMLVASEDAVREASGMAAEGKLFYRLEGGT